MRHGIVPFWQALLNNPKQIGAVWPAGSSLTAAMLKEVFADAPGLVIELGGGTGVITQGLFDARSHFSGLLVYERTPSLANCLQNRFPDITIHPTCASHVDQLDLTRQDSLTLVSSLPFRSLPQHDRTRLERSIVKVSADCPRFRLIQYSYFKREPFPSPATNLRWRQKQTVIRNIPPATLWVLEKTGDLPAGRSQ